MRGSPAHGHAGRGRRSGSCDRHVDVPGAHTSGDVAAAIAHGSCGMVVVQTMMHSPCDFPASMTTAVKSTAWPASRLSGPGH